jgi:SAM-dependent methyltransferase
MVKLFNAKLCFERLEKLESRLKGTILELGGGSLQVATMIKWWKPDLTVIGSDISPEAVALHQDWEAHFGGAKLDGAFPCSSDDIPLADESVDVVLAFQAAHHFRTHRKTLREVARVLRPGGVCLYIQEPVCRRWIYPVMYRIANREGAGPTYGVLEDVLVLPKLLQIGKEEGFRCSYELYPPPLAAGLLGTCRKVLLLAAPFLKRWTFSMADIIFEKVTPHSVSMKGPATTTPRP